MSQELEFVGIATVKGTRYAKFQMNLGGASASTFQQTAEQLRDGIQTMKKLKKPAERIAAFQSGLDAIEGD